MDSTAEEDIHPRHAFNTSCSPHGLRAAGVLAQMTIIQSLTGFESHLLLAPGASIDLALSSDGQAVGQDEQGKAASTGRPRPVRADVAQGVVVAATAETVEHNRPLYTSLQL